MMKKPKKQSKRKAQPDFSQIALSAVERAVGGKLVGTRRNKTARSH